MALTIKSTSFSAAGLTAPGSLTDATNTGFLRDARSRQDLMRNQNAKGWPPQLRHRQRTAVLRGRQKLTARPLTGHAGGSALRRRISLTHCSTSRDKTLLLTNKRTLAQRDARELTADTHPPKVSDHIDHPLSAAELLRRWLQSEGTAERFRGCHMPSEHMLKAFKLSLADKDA
jgi:hypothetical protein